MFSFFWHLFWSLFGNIISLVLVLIVLWAAYNLYFDYGNTGTDPDNFLRRSWSKAKSSSVWSRIKATWYKYFPR